MAGVIISSFIFLLGLVSQFALSDRLGISDTAAGYAGLAAMVATIVVCILIRTAKEWNWTRKSLGIFSTIIFTMIAVIILGTIGTVLYLTLIEEESQAGIAVILSEPASLIIPGIATFIIIIMALRRE